MKRTTIAALLTLATVTVGVLASGCGGLPGGAVAKVGDVLIPDKQYTSQLESYATQYGLTKDSDPENYRSLAASVLDGLVTTELAVQKAPGLDIAVTDAEIQAKIDSIVNDYYSGDQSALVTDLAKESLTLDDLKKQVSDYLISGLVRDQVTKEVPAATDQEIAAYYDENKASYLTEQTVDARHILVGVAGATVRSSVTTTTTTLPAESPESTTTTAATTTTTLSELAWARALATAAQVRADLLEGGSWSQLAARYSTDSDTKSKGGELGTVSQGALADNLGQEFEAELFSLELNKISELVKTTHGYEIIQVTKINEARQKTLDEARAEIAAELLATAQDAAWQKFIEQAKADIKVVYRSDVRPTTTTLAPTTTTVAPAATITSGATTSTAKP